MPSVLGEGSGLRVGTPVAQEDVMAFPHYYSAHAEAVLFNGVVISSGGVPSLRTAPPPEFGGPGDQWSPETLVVAAIADCIIMTFQSIATAKRFAYKGLACDVQGKLDRQSRVTSFTEFNVRVRLSLPAGAASEQDARALVERAKEHCLLTNSLKGLVHLETTVHTYETEPVPVAKAS
jgi:organic hydroperoxide reductase OsmC/OhrA